MQLIDSDGNSRSATNTKPRLEAQEKSPGLALMPVREGKRLLPQLKDRRRGARGLVHEVSEGRENAGGAGHASSAAVVPCSASLEGGEHAAAASVLAPASPAAEDRKRGGIGGTQIMNSSYF
ncbi:unnamed protein product [Calypogeia fissa]